MLIIDADVFHSLVLIVGRWADRRPVWEDRINPGWLDEAPNHKSVGVTPQQEPNCKMWCGAGGFDPLHGHYSRRYQI